MATLASISPPLRERLLTLRLCSERDLRRARRPVRRLARDLPAFDSVWLDALVQLGTLTPFQVRQLEADRTERLVCGPCQILAELTVGSRGATYLARRFPSAERCAIKFLDCSPSRAGELLPRLHDLIGTLARADSPQLGRYTHCEPTSTGLALISPFVEGPTLADLLIRRGRFPARVVAEIGRQALLGLATLERLGVVHGDLRSANVRLKRDGVVVLVDGGLRPLLHPVETVHAGLPADHYDGIAPELINSLHPATPQSDLYALGCLLWQLLVGRPVFPGGSPLVKLASHHSRTPPQLLDQAPETPPRLRELVESLMRPDPLQRPLSATQLLTIWESTCGAAPALLRQFRREFDAPVPLRRPVRGSRPMAGLAAVALLLVTLWSAGRVSLPVVGRDAELVENGGEGAAPADSSPADSSPANLAGESVTSTGTAANAAKDARNARASADRGRAGLANLQLLPEPNERGELSLSAGACYLARPLNVVGGLVIRAAGTPAPTVVVRAPWQVVAESVRLEGFDIQGELPPQADPEGTLATLDLQAQSLVARQLRMTGVARSPELGGAPPAIRWQLVDLRDTRPTVAEFDSCLFQGGVAVLVTPQPVTAVRLSHCLVVDHEAVLELAGESRRSRVVSLDLNQVTLRGGGGVLRWWGGVGPPSGLQVVLDLKSSVVEATSDSLVTLISSRRGSEWRGRLRIRGDGALVSPDQPLLSWRSGQTGEAQPLSTDGFSVEGVLTGPLEFVGNRPDHPADSVLRSVAGPRRSAAEPGMDPRRLRADPGLLAN